MHFFVAIKAKKLDATLLLGNYMFHHLQNGCSSSIAGR